MTFLRGTRLVTITTLGRAQVVCAKTELAVDPVTRMRGLLGRDRLERDEGLLLHRANAIHTAFMRFPIDAVFLDVELRVVGVRSRLLPWRVAVVRGADSVLELAAGVCEQLGIEPGAALAIDAGAA